MLLGYNEIQSFLKPLGCSSADIETIMYLVDTPVVSSEKLLRLAIQTVNKSRAEFVMRIADAVKSLQEGTITPQDFQEALTSDRKIILRE